MVAPKCSCDCSASYQNIAVNLQKALETLGIAVGDLAARSNLDADRVTAMIECTAEEITVLEAERVAHALDKPVTWLLTAH
jgi:hypothetical protein|tara:strand:+ start:9996 stop:10238 length:243 start_codon:yes stop_codon:yes gene_type:complete